MDYFDSIFVCIAIFCSVLVFCVLCCNSSKDSEEPIHHADVVVTSSSHTPLRRADSGDFHPLRSADLERPERPIGFTSEVISGSPRREPVRPPNPPYPVENLMPAPEIPSRTSSDHPSPRDDVNPPSYEQVMNNESYYLHPQRN